MATGTSRSKRRRLKYKKLLLSEVICPICFNILIEPVTLPCNHELCMTCFKQCIHESFYCPVCRFRISTWVRKHSRQNSLVNTERWNQIQRHFPEAVNQRLNGADENLTIKELSVKPVLSQPGEIREEYEQELKRFQEELKEKRDQENRASEELIQKLHEEEKISSEQLRKENELIAARDEVLVKSLCKEMKRHSNDESQFITEFLEEASSSKSGIKTEVQAPPLQKNKELSEPTSVSANSADVHSRSQSADSLDSISPEMHHFKPIKTAPLTPPKRLPDGKYLTPKLIHSTPHRLDFNFHRTTLSDIYPTKSCRVLLEKLESIDIDRKSFQPYDTKNAVSGPVQYNSDVLFFQNNAPFLHRESSVNKYLTSTIKSSPCSSKVNIEAKENIELSKCQRECSWSSGKIDKLWHKTEILESNNSCTLSAKEKVELNNKKCSGKKKDKSEITVLNNNENGDESVSSYNMLSLECRKNTDVNCNLHNDSVETKVCDELSEAKVTSYIKRNSSSLKCQKWKRKKIGNNFCHQCGI